MKAWLPSAFLALALGATAVALTAGGMVSVGAWLVLLVAGPFMGAAFLLGAAGRTLWTRRATLPVFATALLAVVLLLPLLWLFRVWPMAYPSRVSQDEALTIRVPTDQPLRVVWGGDDPAGNQHALMPDQRWAYDLVVEPTDLTSDDMANWGCFGVPVVAPVAGRVTQSENEQPDATPGTATGNTAVPLGNHVAIQPAQGGFLLIAHLQRGSVRVAAGEEVAEGDPIGACGNSGNTSGAHVHVHYQRQDPGLYPFNFAEGLPLAFRDHGGPPAPRGGIVVDGDVVRMTGEEILHRR